MPKITSVSFQFSKHRTFDSFGSHSNVSPFSWDFCVASLLALTYFDFCLYQVWIVCQFLEKAKINSLSIASPQVPDVTEKFRNIGFSEINYVIGTVLGRLENSWNQKT